MNIVYCPHHTIDALTAGLMIYLAAKSLNMDILWTDSEEEAIEAIHQADKAENDACIFILRYFNYEEDSIDLLASAAHGSSVDKIKAGLYGRGYFDFVKMTAPEQEGLVWEVENFPTIKDVFGSLQENMFFRKVYGFVKSNPHIRSAEYSIFLNRHNPRSFKLHSSLNNDTHSKEFYQLSENNKHLLALMLDAIPTFREDVKTPTSGDDVIFKDVVLFDYRNEIANTKVIALHRMIADAYLPSSHGWYGYVVNETFAGHSVKVYCIRNVEESVNRAYAIQYGCRRNFAGFLTFGSVI